MQNVTQVIFHNLKETLLFKCKKKKYTVFAKNNLDLAIDEGMNFKKVKNGYDFRHIFYKIIYNLH